MASTRNGTRKTIYLAGAAALALLGAASTSVGCGADDCSASATCGAGVDDAGGQVVDGFDADEASEIERGIGLSLVDPQSPKIVAQGESLELAVRVERRAGSRGEIKLALSGLPAGATEEAADTIATGAMEGRVTLRAAPTTPQGLATITLTASELSDGARSELEMELLVRGGPGSLDTTFGDVGVQRTIFASPGLVGTGRLLSVMGRADGRVLVGGQRVNNATVAQLSAKGELDTTFGGAGFASLLVSQGFVRLAPAPAAESTYVLAGPGGLAGALFLIDQAGAAATSFNGTGRRDVDVGPGPFGAHDLATVSGGKVLVLSRYQTMAGGQGLGVARYLPDGTSDSSYGVDGLCSITVAGTGGAMLGLGTLLVAPDGSARVHASAVGGSSGFVKGCTSSGALDVAVGPAPDHVQTGIMAGRAARASSGELVVVSESSWRRYNAGGVADTSVGVLGTVSLPSGVVGSAVLVQDDFKVLVGGSDGGAFKVLRYLPNGELDPDFGEAGVVTLDVAGEGGTASLEALAFQAGGRLLVGGTRYDDDATDAVVARLWR